MSATANIANVANTHKTPIAHKILVSLDKENNVVLHAPNNLELGDTAHFHTHTVGGLVEIYLDVNGSPFLNDDGTENKEVDSNDPPLELKARGTFTVRCYITVGKFKYSYNTNGPGSGGGNMVVR